MTTTMTVARGALAWLNRQSAPLLLAATTAGLAVGGLAYLAGAGGAADLAWLATAACGLGYALWIAAASLRRGRLSVDVIALLALAGAIAVGELLAAAVISVMLASGRALEDWAAYRARHDLSALLAGRRGLPGVTGTGPWRPCRWIRSRSATCCWWRPAMSSR
jgi:cation transport ATPase